MSIESAEAKIHSLKAENADLMKKIADCRKVISALESDKSLLGNIQGKVSAASATASKIATGADTGKNAFSNGAFYVGQDETGGNSKTFDDLNSDNDKLISAIQNAVDIITTKIGEAGKNIETATAAMNEYQSKINSNNAEIESLQAYIEEERRKQQESQNEGDSAAADAYEEARRNGWGTFAKM